MVMETIKMCPFLSRVSVLCQTGPNGKENRWSNQWIYLPRAIKSPSPELQTQGRTPRFLCGIKVLCKLFQYAEKVPWKVDFKHNSAGRVHVCCQICCSVCLRKHILWEGSWNDDMDKNIMGPRACMGCLRPCTGQGLMFHFFIKKI